LGFIYRILAMYQILAGERLSGLKSTLQSLAYNFVDWKAWIILGAICFPKKIIAWFLQRRQG